MLLPGRVADVAAWYRRAEVLVHPARWEGFGLALLEAMLAGKPVVAIGVSSLPEIVVDGETGLLVPARRRGALAETCWRCSRDPARSGERCGEAGRARAAKEFSVDADGRRGTLAVYERPLGRAGRQRSR